MNPTRFGKYLLIDQISRGGMAEVYLAKAIGAQGFERVVALKRILPVIAEDPDFQTMFIDEAKISSSLTHANIGQVYEFGQTDDTYFLTMEYIAGKDIRAIRTRLAERKRHMAVPMALYICGQLCQALDHAHRMTNLEGESMQIVHRDVSPPNVVVSYQGAVKLIDFGIARARSRLTRTRTGKLKGKFAYMSPEQVEGVPLDHRSDIFATGTLLFEMLTHQRPFRGDNELAVMNAIRKGNCPPPSTVNPDVPLAVDEIVMKALSRDRDKRYAWASEVFEAIQAYLGRVSQSYGASDLVAWMQDAFRPEIEASRQLLLRLRELRPEDCDDDLLGDEDEEGDTLMELPRGGAPSSADSTMDPRGAYSTHDTAITENPSSRTPVSGSSGAPMSQDADAVGGDPIGVDTTGVDAKAPEAVGVEQERTDPEGHENPPALVQPHDQPIYPGGQNADVVGALDIATDPAVSRPSGLADARDLHRQEQAVEVEGPVETYPTHRASSAPAPAMPRVKTERTLISRPPVPPPPPADLLGKLRYYALHLSRGLKTGSGRLSSAQVMMIAGGATLFILLLIVALVSTCGGDPSSSSQPPEPMGSLLVTTSESAICTVKLDGQTQGMLSSGNTLTVANVRPGRHIVSLHCHGYHFYTASVRVKSAEVSLVDAPLKKE